MAASNTLLQTLVDDDKRGRVMSFYTMAFFGMMPLGSLAAGVFGSRIGAPATVTWGGVATIVAVLLYAYKLPDMRKVVRSSSSVAPLSPTSTDPPARLSDGE